MESYFRNDSGLKLDIKEEIRRLSKISVDLNLNNLLVTHQITLFHHVVRMGEKLVHSSHDLL